MKFHIPGINFHTYSSSRGINYEPTKRPVPSWLDNLVVRAMQRHRSWVQHEYKEFLGEKAKKEAIRGESDGRETSLPPPPFPLL